ncbi:hypothetical protein KR084_009952 [Drosophila pseudotakahashii]|nr:hypothetical protein KR084_009952 [Drosophila pseudotakahashii]
MDNAHPMKIPTKAISLFEKPPSDDGNPEGYDLYMGIWELSVSLGNFNHNVDESVKFITENNAALKNPFELVLLNDFRMKFERLQKGTDSEEQTIHETRGDLFMSLYKELLDIEKDETRRCGYMNLCYELFDSVQPKLNGRKKSFTYRVEVIDRLHAQVQNILNRLNGTPGVDVRSSDSLVNIQKEPLIDGLSNEISDPPREIVSEESIEKIKLDSSRVYIDILKTEGYAFIESCTVINKCISEGFRIEMEMPEITSQKMITGPDMAVKENESNRCLKNELSSPKCTINSSDKDFNEIPSLDLSFTSEVNYNAFDESVFLAFKNPNNSPEDDLIKTPISDLGILPGDNYAKVTPFHRNCIDDNEIIHNDHVIVAEKRPSSELYDIPSKRRRNIPLTFNPVDTFSEKQNISNNSLNKGDFSDCLEIKDVVPLNIEEAVDLNNSEQETLSEMYLDKNVISCGMESNNSSLTIEEVDTVKAFEIETIDANEDDFNEILDDCDDLNIIDKAEARIADVSKRSCIPFKKAIKRSEKLSKESYDTHEKGYFKGAFEIPISDNFKRRSCKTSKVNFDQYSQDNLETVKDLFEDYKNKLDAITELEERMDSENLKSNEKLLLFKDTDENGTLPKNDLSLEEVDFTDDKIMSQLRQTVSDIKLNFLKKVDKTLDLTLQNPSETRSMIPFLEKTRNESKNYGRNSKFTDELRLHSPRRRSPKNIISKHSAKKVSQKQSNKTCRKMLSPKLSPIKKAFRDLSENNHTVDWRFNKEINRKDEVKRDFLNSVESYGEKDEESNCNCEECCLVKDDYIKSTLEKSYEFVAEQDDQEMPLPISSHIIPVDKSSTKFLEQNRITETCIECEKIHRDLLKRDSSEHLSIDISKKCHLVNDMKYYGTETLNAFVEEQDDKKMLLLVFNEISQTNSGFGQPILKKEDTFKYSYDNERNSTNLELDIENLKTSSNSKCMDISEKCLDLPYNLSLRQTKEAVDEQDNKEMLSPILSQITQTVSEVKLNILKEVDKSLSELTLKSFSAYLQSEENIKNKSKSPDWLTKESDIIFEISEESAVGKNQRREKAKNVSELTLKNNSNTSSFLLRKPSEENIKNKSKNPNKSENSEFSQNSEESNAIFDICRECDIKVNYSKELDKYIAEGLSIRSRNCNEVARHNGSGDLNVSCEKSKIQSCKKSLPKWQHQRHIIAAPRAIIKNFKSNSSYEWCLQDPKAPDFYEQLDQFFEITGQRKWGSAFDICVSSIQSRLCTILRRLPREESYSDWMATVGKCNLGQLLTRNERNAYETLRWQSRDTGDQDLSAGSRFTDALHGMMGYESPHLKVSAITGRLQMRSPQHQDSISESYLLLILGHLGYFYRELKENLAILNQRGETAAALRKSLQKYLLNFHQFYETQKKNPCSLLSLYRQTRGFQLQFQWLLDVLHYIQNEESIIVSLYEESGLRIGYQRSLLLKWLIVASQPLINRLQQWLLSGRLNSTDSLDELFIERSITSNTNDFWQKRYQITEHFSSLFDSQLNETLISVGKTLKYSQKYLGIKVETCLSGKELRNILQETFEHFYQYGEQEPLYEFLRHLHSEVSGEVLKQLREMQPNPEYLFAQLHKYVMLTDVKFIRDFINTFEAVLGEPESFFNIRLFNEMKEQRLRKPIPDLYIDKGLGEGTRCWSRLVLRWKLPNHWIALLGEDAEEYEAISTALWRFRYVDYVLCERIFRQRTEIHNRIDFKYFQGLEETFNCFGKLISMCLDLMKVLRQYFFRDLLEPAFERLLSACYEAITLDEILEANRIYLKTIKLGCMQTNSLRKSNQYLDRLYNFILRLDDKQQKFFKLCKTSMDYVLEVRLKSSHNMLSNYYRNQMLNFRWTCENYTDVIDELRDQFTMAMISFLFSLHLSDEDSLRSLALSLDPKGYYIRKDNKLRLVQSFEFKRKTGKSSSA